MSGNINLHIQLFGHLSIAASGCAPIRMPPSRAGSLLALLALEIANPRPRRREEVVDLLWPEDDADEARHKLRQTLYDVRRQVAALDLVPERVLLSTRTSLQLNPEYVYVDAASFEAELRSASSASNSALRVEHLQRAVTMYGGDLLPGFYQECFLAEKIRLEEVYHAALKSLALAYEEAEEYVKGIEIARMLIGVNSLNEEAHFTLMRLYAATGQPSSVLRQYQNLEQVLQDELGEAPSRSAQNMMSKLRETALARAAEREVGARPTSGQSAEKVNLASPVSTLPDPGGHSADTVAESRAAIHMRPRVSLPFASRARAWSTTVAAAVMLVAALLTWSRHTAKTAAIVPKRPAAPRSHAVVMARYAPAADERGSEPTALAIDDSGNLYLAGFVQTTHNDADFITIKYDPKGCELWRRRYNGTGNDVDRARCIAVDAGGNVFVTGESDNGNGNNTTRLSGLDVVTIKYSPAGQELWQDRYNDIDDGEDRPVKMVLDSTGNAYVLCSCRRQRNGTDAGCDFVLIKYGPNGRRLWLQRYDGEARHDATPTGMALLYKDSGVCVCGYSRAVYKSGPEYDYVTIKYSADGKCLWKQRYGANNHADDYARNVSSDLDGNVYVVGDGHGLPGTPDESKTGCIMVKYSPAGEMLWARGTMNEQDRLPRVTATAFWVDGYAAVAGPVIAEGNAAYYRTVLRDTNGEVAAVFNNYVVLSPYDSAPCALLNWPEDTIQHDSVWMIGSQATRSQLSLEFTVAALSHHEGIRWWQGFSPSNDWNAVRAAVFCKLNGQTKFVVAGLCKDRKGQGGITLVGYSE